MAARPKSLPLNQCSQLVWGICLHRLIIFWKCVYFHIYEHGTVHYSQTHMLVSSVQRTLLQKSCALFRHNFASLTSAAMLVFKTFSRPFQTNNTLSLFYICCHELEHLACWLRPVEFKISLRIAQSDLRTNLLLYQHCNVSHWEMAKTLLS